MEFTADELIMLETAVENQIKECQSRYEIFNADDSDSVMAKSALERKEAFESILKKLEYTRIYKNNKKEKLK